MSRAGHRDGEDGREWGKEVCVQGVWEGVQDQDPTSSLAEDLSPQFSSTSVRSDSKTDSFTTKASGIMRTGELQYYDPLLGGVFTVAWQLGSPPRASLPAFTENVSTTH